MDFCLKKKFFQQVAQRRFVFIRRTKNMPTRETKILVLFLGMKKKDE